MDTTTTLNIKKTADIKAYMAEYNKKYSAEHSKDKRHCETCRREINRYAWNKHLKTQKHLLNEKLNTLSLGEIEFKQKLMALCKIAD